jgi:hypothetical protein
MSEAAPAGTSAEIEELEQLWQQPAYGEARVVPVRQLGYEQATRAKFERWLGGLALKGSAEVGSAGEQPRTNLLDRLRAAKAGSETAKQSLDIDIATASAEFSFKTDHITEITTRIDADGDQEQFGQKMHDVQANALTMRPGRHEILQGVSKVEALNTHRIKAMRAAGDLRDHYYVVPSIVPFDVPEKQLDERGDGYFVHSMTYVAQATTEESENTVTTESGFMAGVEAGEHDSFEDRQAKRHDIAALSMVYEALGVELPPTRDAAGFLDNGILIPKSMMPGGVADFMRWCQEATAILHGEAPPHGSEFYRTLLARSREREASLAKVNERVRDILLASADTLANAIEASKFMWKTIKHELVDESLENTDIDPVVFGAKSAAYIHQVRQQYQMGDIVYAQELLARAHKTAKGGGCGGGSTEEGEDGENQSERSGNRNRADKEDCEFTSETCPLCKSKKVKTRVTKRADGKKLITGSCGCSKVEQAPPAPSASAKSF